MKTQRLRGLSPALVVSLVALVVALGGTAYASGLISGSQIKDHTIPAKKLTQSAITSLHGQRGPRGPKGDTGPQGPGAISFLKGDVPADSTPHVVTTIDGVTVAYNCHTNQLTVSLFPAASGDTLYASGDVADDGTLSSIQASGHYLTGIGTSTVNLDVIAWAGSVGTISRFDLGGYANDSTACNIWGLITPGNS
jgi:hypothetical protein